MSTRSSSPFEDSSRVSLLTAGGAAAGSRWLAITLLWLTAVWNVAEGIVAVTSGILARSVALVGFGFDSFIEVTAALILLWRLSLPDHDERAEGRERAAHRVVGATFIALSVYIAT